MELRDWLTIAALILGPILAVQVSELLALRKETKRRKNELFQKLMSTRAARLSAAHVEALNMIDLTFYGDKEVINAWKLYLDHLRQTPDGDAWNQKSLDLMNDMLETMSKSLGFEIDKLTIKKSWYHPTAFSKAEQDNEALRKAAVEMFTSGALQKALESKAEAKPDTKKAVVDVKKNDGGSE